MAYLPTTEQLIDDAQNYLDLDPRFFDQDEGSFEWWGRVVEFFKTADEINLRWDEESISFPRYV